MVPEYVELPTSIGVKSVDMLDPQAYLEFNADVRAANLDATDHFTRYGINEGRRQFVNSVKIRKLRREKLACLSFKKKGGLDLESGDPVNFLSQEVRNSFEIPESPPIASNDYNPELIELVQKNREKLFLDVGAGLRHTYYSNVINAEIWASVSTDVVCIGEDLPFADDQFDYVFCLAVLEHTKQPWLATQEIIRVAKPGGIIRIDWPFLQPVHGYPYHFFNATPKGNISQFNDQCDIVSCDVRPWQHPIFTLTWFLQEWRRGLPSDEQEAFDQITLRDLLASLPEQQLNRPYCSQLGPDAQQIIAAGTTLIARKR